MTCCNACSSSFVAATVITVELVYAANYTLAPGFEVHNV
jgi:hypothetical protein